MVMTKNVFVITHFGVNWSVECASVIKCHSSLISPVDELFACRLERSSLLDSIYKWLLICDVAYVRTEIDMIGVDSFCRCVVYVIHA